MPKLDNLIFEDARLMFRNFAGRAAQFNADGDRNFCIFLDGDKAESLKEEGWNVKYLRPKEEGDEPQAYLQVSVSYKNRPPKIVIITTNNRTEFDESMIPVLDYAEIKQADVVLNPYAWTMHEGTPMEKKGIKAYLKSAFIILDEDPLELKYAEDPIGQTPAMASTANED